MNFSNESKQLTKQLSKEDKKKNGIYFTPPTIIAKIIKVLFPYFKNIVKILEPSCGSGEFIQRFERFPKFNIDAIEYNETIYNSIKSKFKSTILNTDFLEWSSTKKYDLIVGNPPFYVMKKNQIKNNKYEHYYTGRPNIFVLFIAKSLELLENNGILSFVLPKNFMNCLYYNSLRKYISTTFKIIDIIECYQDKYLETQQDTIVLIIQKQNSVLNNSNYTININNYTIFNTPSIITQIKTSYQNTTTLKNMNFEVKVGNVVWNQVKDKLTDDESETRLIYSSDIVNNEPIFELAKGSAVVQIGAFDSKTLAKVEWHRFENLLGSMLISKKMVIQEAESGGKIFYRLRAAGFDDISGARQFCTAISDKVACIPVAMR